ncbi:MAG: BspA family leucine-rich repeat surface protein, partial [Proteobacteria bacterium]|nr:BspA family leucine-rich repeat surface protein [Pseudomonadota bacterium]
NVTNMREMFYNAEAFNQPLNQWDVSNVNDMTEMFREALSFNHYPSSWIVPKGKTDSMFDRTPIEKQAKQNPLKTRKVKK